MKRQGCVGYNLKSSLKIDLSSVSSPMIEKCLLGTRYLHRKYPVPCFKKCLLGTSPMIEKCMLGTNIFIEIIQSHDWKMSAWDQSQAAIFNLGPGVSTQSHVFTQSHVLRNPCLGPVPSSHFQLGTSPMLSIIPTWDRSHVGILTSNYKLEIQDLFILLFVLFQITYKRNLIQVF